MASKTRSLEERVAQLEKQVEQGLRAHETKINELEIEQLAKLRNEIRKLAARVHQIEEKLDLTPGGTRTPS